VTEHITDFVEEELKSNKSIYVTSFEQIVTDSIKQIAVSVNGKYLEDHEINLLQSRLSKYKLNDYSLVIYQNETGLRGDQIASMGQQFKVDILADLYDKNEQKLQSKEDEIALLKNELLRIELEQMDNDKMVELTKSQFAIEDIAFENVVYNKKEGKDTVMTIMVRWDPKSALATRKIQKAKMTEMFKIQFNCNQVYILDLD
jgi:hypothetical protein